MFTTRLHPAPPPWRGLFGLTLLLLVPTLVALAVFWWALRTRSVPPPRVLAPAVVAATPVAERPVHGQPGHDHARDHAPRP